MPRSGVSMLIVLAVIGCGGDDDAPAIDATASIDATLTDAPLTDAPLTDAPLTDAPRAATDATSGAADAASLDAAAPDAVVPDAAPPDAIPVPDAVIFDAGIDANPVCAMVGSQGQFPSCSICTDFGRDCDTLDIGGTISHHCDCSTSDDCPCGLRCGSREIAPGISVGGLCVR